MKYLLADASWGDISIWIIIAVLLLMFVVLSFVRRKRETQQRNDMVNEFKTGTKIVTTSGIYGEIKSITETTDGKVVVIETGEGNNKTTMTIHINAIMTVDKKKPIVYDENGNDITKYEDDVLNTIAKNKQEKTDEVKEEPSTSDDFSLDDSSNTETKPIEKKKEKKKSKKDE